MITPICPQCKMVIEPDDINVAKDIAYCRACEKVCALSEITQNVGLDDTIDLMRPPKGAWYESAPEGTRIGASHRSLVTALGLLAVSLFWNGIVSVFVLLNIANTLNLIGIGLPEWLPVGNSESSMGFGMTLFLWVFLTPFIAIGTTMVLGFLMALFGKEEVILSHHSGKVFVGIGALGWTRRFDGKTISSVRLVTKNWRDSDGDAQSKSEIVLTRNDGKEMKFGGSMPKERRKFVAAALQQTLRC